MRILERESPEYLVGILLNVGNVFLKVTLGFFIILKMGIGLNSSEVSGFSTSWQSIRPAVRRRAYREIMVVTVMVRVRWWTISGDSAELCGSQSQTDDI